MAVAILLTSATSRHRDSSAA